MATNFPRAGHDIENPQAYENAKQMRIRINRCKTGHRKWVAAHGAEAEAIIAWMNHPSMKEIIDEHGYETHIPNEPHPAGSFPRWLDDAISQWGGLTDKQHAVAIRMLTERTEKNAARQAAFAAEKAAAPEWTEGRQQVSGVILKVRETETHYGYSRYGQVVEKAFIKIDDGRTCWGTNLGGERGSRVTFTATFTPADNDPKHAFYKRPTKWTSVTKEEA